MLELSLSVLMATSLTMGIFSVTQLGYQNRVGGLKMFLRGILAFTKGSLLWPYFFPRGVIKGKYRMNVFHKIGNTTPNI